MTSTLACVGLAVSDETGLDWLVTRAHRAVREIGVFGGVHVGRWQDDSDATLILGWRSGELLDFIPAYTATSGGLLSGCHLINDSVAAAAVVDADGRQLTAMAFEAEQYRQLHALGSPVSGPARITALGVAVQIHQDADAFAASPDSQLDPSAGPAQEPPPHYREKGWSWPPRLAAESFLSYGVFGDPAQARPRARLSGTVLTAAQHVCALTGQPFTMASVRTAGFTTDLCLAASEHPGAPAPGTIISGTVYLCAAIDAPRGRLAVMSSDEPADDGEDREPAPFILMPAGETFDGQERVMSRAAYDLQVLATAHSASCGHPGYVPDDYLEHLDGLGVETTITAAELCAIGTWERAGGGYRILDWEAVEYALDRVRQDRGDDPQALAADRDHEAKIQARMATPLVITPPCAACGAPSAHIELVAPGQLPAGWDQRLPGTMQGSILRRPDPGRWYLLAKDIATGTSCGGPIDASRAGQIAWAFWPPLRFAQVRTARFDGDAGFCPDCDAPYCHQHWHLSGTGYGYCPYGHGKDLDPHWSPLTAITSSRGAP